jgi:hypothetical protein
MAHSVIRGAIAVVLAALIIAAGAAVVMRAPGTGGSRVVDYTPAPSAHATR